MKQIQGALKPIWYHPITTLTHINATFPLVLIFFSVLLGSCSEKQNGHIWQAEVEMKPAFNESRVEGVVEVNLIAEASLKELLPGVFTQVYTYNGTSPGPMKGSYVAA